MIVVVGAPGSDEYAAGFREWADQWRVAAEKSGAEFTLVGGDEPAGDRLKHRSLRNPSPPRTTAHDWSTCSPNPRGERTSTRCGWCSLATAASTARRRQVQPARAGRGRCGAGRVAGADQNAARDDRLHLGQRTAHQRRVGAPGRIVITATKSGFELNFARFGKYLAAAIAEPRADLDKDGQTSLLGGVPDGMPRRGRVLRRREAARHGACRCSTTMATAWARQPRGFTVCGQRSVPSRERRSTAYGRGSFISCPATASRVCRAKRAAPR